MTGWITALLLFLLAGCAAHDSSRAAARLSGLIGLPEAAVRERLGAPDRQSSADGRTYLIYDSNDVFFVPGTDGIPPRRATFHCETTVEIAAGRMSGFDQHGSGCD